MLAKRALYLSTVVAKFLVIPVVVLEVVLGAHHFAVVMGPVLIMNDFILVH